MGMVKNIDKRLDIADEFQKEAHQMIEMILGATKKASYQDAMNTYLFQKLAEFELRLRELESTKKSA